MPIEELIYQTISETTHKPLEEIKTKDKLLDLAEDSIQLFELLINFEKKLKREINLEDIINVETVEDIIVYAHSLGIYTI